MISLVQSLEELAITASRCYAKSLLLTVDVKKILRDSSAEKRHHRNNIVLVGARCESKATHSQWIGLYDTWDSQDSQMH